MNEKEIISANINKYMDLQKIIKSDNPKKEAENQIKPVKAILETCGVTLENLELED